MRVGYISDIQVKRNYTQVADTIINQAIESNLNYLIVNGGISSDYVVTENCMNYMGKALQSHDIVLRFTTGNTDYYAPHQSIVDKTHNFNTIDSYYKANPYYLVTHPIITQSLWIIGASTWYDYSLYRGNPISLSKVTKKSKWFISANQDTTYITDKDDYKVGLVNTFDKKRTQYCVNELRDILDKYCNKLARPEHCIVCGYFYPHRVYITDGLLAGYFACFKGSTHLGDVLHNRGVTEYVAGLTSKHFSSKSIDNILYSNSTHTLTIKDY